MEHKREYEYLVHLVRCGLQGLQPQEPPKKLSFRQLLALGKEHEVANIAFLAIEKLQNKPDEEVYKAWKTHHALSIRRHANQMAARDAISQTLSEAGIRHLEVQGTIMKTLYPQPYLRLMSDMDFIIDTENLQAGEKLLQRMGYRTEVAPNGLEVNGYGKTGLAVELHTDFFAPGSVCYRSITDAFSYAEPSEGYAQKGTATIFYLYNLLHTVKHYLQKGAGIRRIMDLHILKTKIWPNTDQGYIQRVLEESGYSATAATLISLAGLWFEDEAPREDLKEAARLVFEAGNHGTFQISLANDYKKAAPENKRFYKLRYCKALLFPGKEDIYKAYPRCKELRLPLLLCWVYRWVWLLSKKERRKAGLAQLADIRKAKLK